MIAHDSAPARPAPFEASETKIARAKKHLASLESWVASYMEANPPPYFDYSVPAQVAPPPLGSGQSVTLAISVTFKGPPIPHELSAILGDVVHNLRTALDLMASDLARINNNNPKNVYFPFSESENDFEAMIKRKNFDRAGTDAVELLKKFRPYHGGDVALRAIHDLDVEDKHILLLPVFQGGSGRDLSVVEINGLLTVEVGNGPETIHLTFPPNVLGGGEIIPTLHRLVELTTRVVEAFKALTAT